MAYRLPPLSCFRAFEAAVRYLSLKKAAEELHVTPSAVSQQIRNLESYLGVRLFQRQGNMIQMTQIGADIAPAIRDGLDCFAAAVERAQQGRSHSLDIYAPPSFATFWLVPHLHRFLEANPEISTRVVSAPENIDGTEEVANCSKGDDVRGSGTCRVSIRFGNGHYPGCGVDRLLTPDYVLVCSPSLLPSLRTVEDVRHQKLIFNAPLSSTEKRPSWHEWFETAGVKGVDTEHGLRFSNAVLVHEAALDGQGVALAIRQHVEADVAMGRLVIPFPITVPSEYTYYLVIPSADAIKEEVRAFRAWVLAEIAATPGC